MGSRSPVPRLDFTNRPEAHARRERVLPSTPYKSATAKWMPTIGERTLAFIELLYRPSLNHPEPVWLNANQTKTETLSVHSVDTYSKPESIANLHLPREVQAAAHEIATAPGATPDAAPSATRQDRGPFKMRSVPAPSARSCAAPSRDWRGRKACAVEPCVSADGILTSWSVFGRR